MPLTAPITAVIPNWNRADLLGHILASLALQTHPPIRTIVIDGGSTDDSASVTRRHGAAFHNLDSNLGFAPAVNEGIRQSATEWIAIVNNDVELAAGYLEILLAAADGANAAFATGKILSHHDRSLIDGSYDLVSRACCAWRAGSGSGDCPAWNRPATIQLASFTAILIRRSTFTQIGFLDESFESYLEDVDFGIRCARAGLTGIYEPAAVATHRGGSTLGPWSNRMVRLNSRNQVLLAAKHALPSWALFAGQLLWGLLAIRRGAGFAWLGGKIEGLRRYRATRSEPASAEFFAAQERGIRALATDSYWRWYFRLT